MLKKVLQTVADDLTAYFAARKTDDDLMRCWECNENAECDTCRDQERCWRLLQAHSAGRERGRGQ